MLSAVAAWSFFQSSKWGHLATLRYSSRQSASGTVAARQDPRASLAGCMHDWRPYAARGI